MSNIDVESTIDVCLFEPHGHDSQQNDIFEEELKEPMYMKDEELYIATSPSFPIVHDSKNMMDIVREDAKNMMDMMEKETTPGGDFKEDEYLKTSDSFPIEVCQSWGSDYLQLNLDMSKAFFYVVSPAAADAKDSTTVTSETYDNLATTSSSLETKIVHYPQTEFSTTSSTNTSKDANKSSSTTTSSDQAGKTFENYQNDYPVSYIISDVKKDNEIIWKHVTAADYEQISEKGEVSLMKYDQSKMEQYSLQDAALEISSAPSPAQLVSTEHILGVTIPQVFCCLWEQCGHTSLTSADLIAHVNSAHIVSNDKQTYLCRWKGCVREGKAFNARYKMVTHLRTHTGEKPHVCPVEGCHQAFGRIENMKIHMRSHTGERPYPCLFEGCDKTFANSSDRFKHKRTHMEKKPFRCTVPGCDKQYTDPSTLRKHKRKHVVPPDILHPPSFVFT